MGNNQIIDNDKYMNDLEKYIKNKSYIKFDTSIALKKNLLMIHKKNLFWIVFYIMIIQNV